jgi:hypothetical protein
VTIELEEFAPGRWRVKKHRVNKKLRGENVSLPFVISDSMPPTEQVDGRFYESKSAFRAVGKANGLIEVGNEKPKPRVRPSAAPDAKARRQRSIKTAVDKFKAGVRTGSP